MKNKAQVHAIPTDKPTFPSLGIGTPELGWRSWESAVTAKYAVYYHLYFTTDEEIKRGDKYLDTIIGRIHTSKEGYPNAPDIYRKIVATTNPDLWNIMPDDDGTGWPKDWNTPKIPKIPTDFLQTFVEKQGGIKEVMLEYDNGYDISTLTSDTRTYPDLAVGHKIKLNSDGSVIWSLVEDKIDWEQVFDDAQSMHLQEFIHYYKTKYENR